MSSVNWSYFVLPGGVAREDTQQHIQYRDPKSGDWIEVADNIKRIDFKRMISQDGAPVSEEEANRAYTKFHEK